MLEHLEPRLAKTRLVSRVLRNVGTSSVHRTALRPTTLSRSLRLGVNTSIRPGPRSDQILPLIEMVRPRTADECAAATACSTLSATARPRSSATSPSSTTAAVGAMMAKHGCSHLYEEFLHAVYGTMDVTWFWTPRALAVREEFAPSFAAHGIDVWVAADHAQFYEWALHTEIFLLFAERITLLV